MNSASRKIEIELVNHSIGIAVGLTVSAAESDADAVTTVTISDLGTATLSADHDNGDGSWTLQQSDLVGLTLQRHRSGDGQTDGADAAIDETNPFGFGFIDENGGGPGVRLRTKSELTVGRS